jgi:hypothetical protein
LEQTQPPQEDEQPTEGENDQFISITPEKLAVLSLRRAAEAIIVTERSPELWFFVIPDLYRATYCALVAALRGTHGTGAYTKDLQKQWLDYLEGDPCKEPAPQSERVDTFLNLLKRAGTQTLEIELDMRGSPLRLSDSKVADLTKLKAFRDDIDHVKPKHWSLDVAGLPRIARSAVSVLRQLFNCASIFIHLTKAEFQSAKNDFAAIDEFARRFPTMPPKSWRP